MHILWLSWRAAIQVQMPRDLRLSVLNKPGNKLSQPIRSIPCPLSTNQISLLFTKTHNNLRRYSLSKCHVYLLEVTVGEELARNGHGFYPSWVQKTTEVEYKVIKYDLQVTGISYLLVTKYSSSDCTVPTLCKNSWGPARFTCAIVYKTKFHRAVRAKNCEMNIIPSGYI